MKYEITEKLIYTNSMGPNPIELLKWNLQNITVSPGSKILDLGSGMGLTAVYLANEFNTDVIAYDKDVHPNKALETMLKCAPATVPLPLQGDARALPFATEYFDFIVATDSFIYFGTDDLYIPYISQYLKSNGYLCFTVPGFNKDVMGNTDLPEHLRPFWADECWTWHTETWWKSHIERTGYLRIVECEEMKNSYEFWKEETLKGPEQWRKTDLPVIETDRGEYMGFIKVVAQRNDDGRKP
ncbi:MAG: class I SAM-dependent methyltransferase [Chloroflexota bacterium]